eukprot:TRINITY_DN50850_c0_g1_i1.p1 TRINITY_DN50850_c0_g1~~TRINITY_DN50850_c0_g1_i1.p1  ORF type:complete len:232 (-),score=30.92 TRINITY_DN50850_c0_g1_i1:62-694(-)
MASEPLRTEGAAGGAGGAPPGVQEQVAQEVVRQAAGQAGRAITAGVNEVRFYVTNNPTSLDVLSFVGGLALLIWSAVGCVLGAITFFADPVMYLLQWYGLLFGLVICVIDGPGDKVPRLRAALLQHVSVLHNNVSRTLFYLFVACILWIRGTLVYQLISGYFVFVSVAHFIIIFQRFRAQPQAQDFHEASSARPNVGGRIDTQPAVAGRV